MTDISPIQAGASGALHGKYTAEPPNRTDSADRIAIQRGDDRIELSPEATDAARRAAQGVRTDLVRQVRAEIAQDSYLTEAKLSLAVDRMIDRALSKLG